MSGDTQKLVRGVHGIDACLARGQLRTCGWRTSSGWGEGRFRTTVGSYPLLQYLPALALERAGLSDVATVRGLTVLSLLAFVATTAMVTWGAPAPAQMWRPLLLATMASGALLAYAASSFGEMLAAAMCVAAVLAAHRRRPVAAGVLVMLACLGKETLPPVLFVLAVLAAREDDDGWLPERRMAWAIGLGTVAGFAISSLFNVFRFGTITNVLYVRSEYRVGSVTRLTASFGELFVAPGGGMLAYWPAATLLLGLGGLVAVSRLVRGERRRAVPGLVVFASFLGFTAGLATWWAPFGWLSWGPRLDVPVMPAMLLVTVWVGGGPLTSAVTRVLRSSLAFAAAAAVVLVLAVPQLSVPWRSRSAVAALALNDRACPAFGNVFTSPDLYWRCFDQRAWRLRWSPVWIVLSHADGPMWALRTVGLLTVAVLLVLARQGAKASTPARPGGELVVVP